MDVGGKPSLLCMTLAIALFLSAPVRGVGGDATLSFDLDSVELSAASAHLMDATTGAELFSHRADERRAPASMTKIITMAVIFDALKAGTIRLDDVVVVSARASGMGGSQVFLEKGEEMSVEDLLKAVAISSANDASVALAEHVSGSVEAFVDDMNALGEHLGLINSHFTNPHGLDHPEHYSTARDINHFASYLLRTHPEVTDYTSVWTDWLREDTDDPFWLTNTNRLLGDYPGMDGLKTGRTEESGWCLSATAVRDGTRFIVTVINSPTSDERFDDVERLLDGGFAAAETVYLVEPGDVMAEVPLWEADVQSIELTVGERVVVTVPRGTADQVALRVEEPDAALAAPLSQESPVASVSAELEGTSIAEYSLVPVRNVERCGPVTLFVRMLRRLWVFR